MPAAILSGPPAWFVMWHGPLSSRRRATMRVHLLFRYQLEYRVGMGGRDAGCSLLVAPRRKCAAARSPSECRTLQHCAVVLGAGPRAASTAINDDRPDRHSFDHRQPFFSFSSSSSSVGGATTKPPKTRKTAAGPPPPPGGRRRCFAAAPAASMMILRLPMKARRPPALSSATRLGAPCSALLLLRSQEHQERPLLHPLLRAGRRRGGGGGAALLALLSPLRGGAAATIADATTARGSLLLFLAMQPTAFSCWKDATPFVRCWCWRRKQTLPHLLPSRRWCCRGQCPTNVAGAVSSICFLLRRRQPSCNPPPPVSAPQSFQ